MFTKHLLRGCLIIFRITCIISNNLVFSFRNCIRSSLVLILHHFQCFQASQGNYFNDLLEIRSQKISFSSRITWIFFIGFAHLPYVVGLVMRLQKIFGSPGSHHWLLSYGAWHYFAILVTWLKLDKVRKTNSRQKLSLAPPLLQLILWDISHNFFIAKFTKLILGHSFWPTLYMFQI